MQVELHFTDRGSSRESDARQFLWQNWIEKRCADLLLTTWSREGDRTNSIYKMRPTNGGDMLLTVDISRSDKALFSKDGGDASAVPDGKKREVTEENSYVVFAIERVAVEPPYDVSKARVIPSTVPPPPSTYRLRLKDKDGRAIADF
jgi:hypothetical protein